MTKSLTREALESLEEVSRSHADDDNESGASPSDPSTADVESTTGGSSKNGSSYEGESELRRRIMQEEERNVRRARVLVGIAFAICAMMAVTGAVYYFTKQSDQYAFETEYEGYIKDIMALVKWEVRYNFALMEQLSASITIASHLSGSNFPNHTENDFEITGGFVDGMGGIMSAAFAPLIMEEQREQWSEYSLANQGWIERSAYLKAVHPGHRDALHGTIQDHEHDRRRHLQLSESTSEAVESISEEIFYFDADGVKVPEPHVPGKLFAPIWQVSPADYGTINVNLLSDERIKAAYDIMLEVDHAVMSQDFEVGALFDFLFDENEKEAKYAPHALILVPVYDEFSEGNDNSTEVGFIVGITVLSNLFDRLLPNGVDGIIAVLKDSCGSTLSYELTSTKAIFLGYEDVHETEFDDYMRYQGNLEMYEETVEGLCYHDLYVYPSSEFRVTYDTSRGYVYASVVFAAFLVTAGLLVIYDMMVNRRQNKVLKAASRTQAIVTSLFPKDIGRKLVEEAYNDDPKGAKENAWKKQGGPALQTILGHDGRINGDSKITSNKPLADLFPEATIFFGDLCGFTAWSSTREPSHVFLLLESLYSEFDQLAQKRKVFKVETVGDCYVAVCGVPEARPDHATLMVRFARDVLGAMHATLHRLTVELGPDTHELGMRIGIHSGPVTAGVLRGERARFQLFGDTVNTAARMESTSTKNRIQVSQQTADLLVASGKKSWIVPRETKVEAKGKGVLQTYWAVYKGDNATRTSTVVSSNDDSSDVTDEIGKAMEPSSESKAVARDSRVVDWTVEILQSLLKEIIARRRSTGVKADPQGSIAALEREILASPVNPFDEVESHFHLPRYTPTKEDVDPSDIELNPAVFSQLQEFVLSISETYHDNPFHNFEHASHVTLSVVKLLKRIVAPTEDNHNESNMHDHTYGITSDPLTQFTVVLSALIHDVDHSGVPNMQLIKEKDRLAVQYDGKSIAEQNSIDIAWTLLMQERFADLRSILYTTTDELKRFRQMLVHITLSTDIMDKELSQERKERWYATFGSDTKSEKSLDPESEDEDETEVNRKATIVIEHLMQASDVAHTMQHWHVYRKWNGRLFKEMYRAYQEGRSTQDPSSNWYQGELGFFDFYIIPLAQKLKSCGVFGVSSDEYLGYALQNRKEWEERGKEVVQELIAEVQKA